MLFQVCPFVAASARVVDSLIELAQISNNDVVLDIGSGDGAILVHIAARLQVPCIGIEIDEILCRTALRRAREASLSTFVDIVAADALYVDPSLASVITIFLVPSCLEVLSPKLVSK